jgi:3-hydroxybutyrate dehydrogenase
VAAGAGHVFVTGGTAGIGLSIAETLLRSSMRVTIVGRDATKASTALARLGSDDAAAEIADVTDEAGLAQAIDSARGRFGTITALVNSAGAVESKAIGDSTADSVRTMLDVNLVAAFGVIRLVLPDLVAHRHGRIVNVASVAGVKGYPYVSAYCAAKHGVIGMTRALALELVSKGVTVNAICPGYTETDLVARQVERLVEKTGETAERVRAKLAAPMAIGRLIDPDEVAATVAWLLAPTSQSITGQAIVLAGCEYMAG